MTGCVIGVVVFWFIQDVTQKKHTVLRNYPVIGRLRFFFEQMGEYFRQYFFLATVTRCRSTAPPVAGFMQVAPGAVAM